MKRRPLILESIGARDVLNWNQLCANKYKGYVEPNLRCLSEKHRYTFEFHLPHLPWCAPLPTAHELPRSSRCCTKQAPGDWGWGVWLPRLTETRTQSTNCPNQTAHLNTHLTVKNTWVNFKPQHQCAYSPLCSIHILYIIEKKNLFKDPIVFSWWSFPSSSWP